MKKNYDSLPTLLFSTLYDHRARFNSAGRLNRPISFNTPNLVGDKSGVSFYHRQPFKNDDQSNYRRAETSIWV